MLRLTLLWEFPECKILACAFGWTPNCIPLKKRVALHSYCKFALLRAHQTGKRFSDFQIPEKENYQWTKSCELACFKREVVLDHDLRF